MSFYKVTEQESNHKDLEKKSVSELVNAMHEEDNNALRAINKVLPNITDLIENLAPKIKEGGRLFYIGAGTSGRLGVLDASECPPTFGTPPEKVVGLVAGGIPALYSSIEIAEDDLNQAWKDLSEYNVNKNDFVIGIAASGTTPYVVHALDKCNQENITTGCITCNKNSPLSQTAKLPIEVIVGPEFLTGSSRMKAGTAQKLVLNMITTTSMIQIGKVKGNKMVDMQLSNDKLVERGVKMIIKELNVSKSKAKELLMKYKNVRKSIEYGRE